MEELKQHREGVGGIGWGVSLVPGWVSYWTMLVSICRWVGVVALDSVCIVPSVDGCVCFVPGWVGVTLDNVCSTWFVGGRLYTRQCLYQMFCGCVSSHWTMSVSNGM